MTLQRRVAEHHNRADVHPQNHAQRIERLCKVQSEMVPVWRAEVGGKRIGSHLQRCVAGGQNK
jgi:hypothetical protein